MGTWTANTSYDLSGQQGFVLAHLSDPHLSSLRHLSVRELLNKRALGYLAWLKRRRREHRPEVLTALQRDLETRLPDHLAVTGDLTHLGTPAECQEARIWLESLGSPARVSVVPGNHDTYAPASWAKTVGLWAPYMANEAPAASTLSAEGFPFVRRRGPLAIIGLLTARPTAPFLASGRLGHRQLAAIEEILISMRDEGRLRVVLLHHPPVPGLVTRRKELDDASALSAVLARSGAELILHGHAHRTLYSTLAVPGGQAPVIGVRSASALGKKLDQHAAYHLYRIDGSPGAWRLNVEERGFELSSRTFLLHREHEILLPSQRKHAIPKTRVIAS